MKHHAPPIFSIIIATHNAELTLRNTLLSIFSQSISNYEIIVVDGASVDNTQDIICEYYSSFAFYVSEPDSGIADAWNKGLLHVNAKWVLFLNSGDILHPEHLARALKIINDHKIDNGILFCDVLKFNHNFELTNKLVGNFPSLDSIALSSIGFAHPGSITSIDYFKEVGYFDVKIKIAIDTDWLLRAFRMNCKFFKFDSITYMAEGGISDRRFKDALVEYYLSATKLELVSTIHAKIFTFLLPIIRFGLHKYRSLLRDKFRVIKHFVLHIANIFSQFLPFYCIRNLYFRFLGFKLSKRVQIAIDFKFYSFGNISIGEGSVINRSCLFDNRNHIKIGKNVSISRNVSIYTGGHDNDSPFFEMKSSPVFINDHAVVYSGAMIMPGVHIGMGAVILCGSVVTKNVEAMTIVGGVPAKVVDRRKSLLMYNLNYTFPLAM